MAENYRSQNIWRYFMQNPEIQRGLQQAGFVSLPFATNGFTIQQGPGTVALTWPATPGRTYQVEYSTNLLDWLAVPTGEVTATNTTASWTYTNPAQSGPTGTFSATLTDPVRFYRAFQYGTP
jgi:hypothetical protein